MIKLFFIFVSSLRAFALLSLFVPELFASDTHIYAWKDPVAAFFEIFFKKIFMEDQAYG
jgi:hypothetical protein